MKNKILPLIKCIKSTTTIEGHRKKHNINGNSNKIIIMNYKIKDITKIALSRSGLRNPFKKLFKVIEFETTSYCNRKCDYCPNVDYERFGDDDDFFMKENVFKTLVDQLEELSFDGLISPHLYGEPMSDHRMLSWAEHIKKITKLKIKNSH